MKRKLTCLLLSLALCLSILPISAYASSDDLNYLALGDSITSGYGLSNNSDGFVVKLSNEIGTTTTVNLGKSGLTTAELLSALKSDSDYQNAVKDADVITITIGGNDLMAVLYQCITALYNSTYGTSLTTTYIQAVLANPSLDQDVYDSILYLVNNTQATSYISSFSSTISATVTNINSIVAQIRAVNTDAVILVANQYNPYQWFSSTGDYAVLKTLFSLVVSSFNSALSSSATSDYVVVDVASVFSSSTSALTNADESTLNLDFHPNAAGHAAIAKAMAAAYEKAVEDSGSSGGDEPAETVSVTYNLDDLTSSNEATTQTKGEAYTTVLTASDGYTLPDSITVTVGGMTLTAGTYYTYDSASGSVNIPAAVVLSDIVITATATTDDVTAPVISGIVDGETYCENVTFTVTDDNLDTVTVDGEAVTEYSLTADGNSHTVVATDKAGNRTTVTVTVNDGHTWDSAVTKEPTCTEEGEKTYTCTVCGDTYTEAVAVTEHSYETIITEPTCTEKGYTTYTCTVCGDSYTADETDATGHGATEAMNAVEATCTENGYTGDTYCSVCGDLLEEGEIISATGHSYGEPVFTWSEDGKTCKVSVTCTVCGDVQSTYATVTSAVKTAATATKKGVTTYTATVTVNGVEYTSTKDVTDIPATGSSSSDSNSSSSSSDNSVNSSASVKTSDSVNLPLWVGLLLLSGTGIATMAVYSWKKRTK